MPKKQSSKTIYSRDEAAEFLSVHPTRVGDFVRDGRLKAQPLGKARYVIEAAELRRFAKIPRVDGRPKKSS